MFNFFKKFILLDTVQTAQKVSTRSFFCCVGGGRADPRGEAARVWRQRECPVRGVQVGAGAQRGTDQDRAAPGTGRGTGETNEHLFLLSCGFLSYTAIAENAFQNIICNAFHVSLFTTFSSAPN